MEIIEEAIRAEIAVEKAVVRVVKAGRNHMRRRNIVAAMIDHALCKDENVIGPGRHCVRRQQDRSDESQSHIHN